MCIFMHVRVNKCECKHMYIFIDACMYTERLYGCGGTALPRHNSCGPFTALHEVPRFFVRQVQSCEVSSRTRETAPPEVSSVAGAGTVVGSSLSSVRYFVALRTRRT